MCPNDFFAVLKVEDDVNSSIKNVFDDYNGPNSNAQSRAIDYVQRQVRGSPVHFQSGTVVLRHQSPWRFPLFNATASVLRYSQLLWLAIHTLVCGIQRQQRSDKLLQK